MDYFVLDFAAPEHSSGANTLLTSLDLDLVALEWPLEGARRNRIPERTGRSVGHWVGGIYATPKGPQIGAMATAVDGSTIIT